MDTPPYNIEQFGQDRLRITLAVAGFSKKYPSNSKATN